MNQNIIQVYFRGILAHNIQKPLNVFFFFLCNPLSTSISLTGNYSHKDLIYSMCTAYDELHMS